MTFHGLPWPSMAWQVIVVSHGGTIHSALCVLVPALGHVPNITNCSITRVAAPDDGHGEWRAEAIGDARHITAARLEVSAQQNFDVVRRS